MSEKADIVYLLRAGQSIRSIQRETGVHRTIVRRLRELAQEAGWLAVDRLPPEAEEITRAVAQANPKLLEAEHPLDAFRGDLRRWVKAGNSYVTIHQLLASSYSCSETTVRRYIQKHFPPNTRATMVRSTIAGESMEVDFGYLGLTYDESEKRQRKTYLFSARLRHSRKAYRERVFCQDQASFFSCHISAFEYFGGVPKKVVPDNLKAAILKASFEDPLVNRAYRSCLPLWISHQPLRTLQPATKGRGGERREVREAQLLAAVPGGTAQAWSRGP